MPRRRAVHVCESCHRRKIRCDIESTRLPCSKCTEIRRLCKLRARKPYRGRKRTERSNSARENDRDHEIVTTLPSSRPDSIKIVAAAIPEPSSRIAPIFVGEGGYGAILDATDDTTDHHFHVPATAEKALAAEDLEYLKIKGCFSLPAESKELTKAYFEFVHPTFPVIDGAAFLQGYAASGFEGINLLLLWSMFSISASYIPTLPRKARKETYTHRAKLLFDLSHETDKIVLVQSALLLSFWFAYAEDVKQSWYWTGIAFSIAQTLGLHRHVSPAHTQFTTQQRAVWRNIWQCCMIRDVWLAFGMGRPLRINASDCDLSLCQFANLLLHGEKLFSSREATGLESIWKDLITTSNFLRDVITSKASSPSRIKSLQDRIDIRVISTSTFLLTHVQRHLKLHQYAVIAAMTRASGLGQADTLKAADSTTALIQTLLDDNTAMYAAPTIIPLLVPAMVTYLATTTQSTKPKSQEARKAGVNQLNVYSRLLTAIEDNYPAASILKRVFAAAQESVDGQVSNQRDEEEAQPGSIGQVLSPLEWDPIAAESALWLPDIGSSI
ncbi:hypothetical protein K458DRAFT_331236 [Lentithecium fluviatile CBS 122367]|uniref:Zn(2)-C6 fungal-type domain-containing protein n=1 Tax=Lentithecium fluviatile CBS 122367 TaxID=1168545 RepID=A0A6G1JEN8_9PLEO|nr:hypothetical protein K458DRAFT_331236 [Lentithecium fluviatile CBS 122367]